MMQSVLLVEDERSLLESLSDALTEEGYRVLTADSGAAALEACRQCPNRVDLLISDVDLGQFKGFQVAAAVRSIHPEVAVVLMSGSRLPEAQEFEGVIEFLQKPFRHEELWSAISRCTGINAQN
jgi:two-component system response regulator GlrR